MDLSHNGVISVTPKQHNREDEGRSRTYAAVLGTPVGVMNSQPQTFTASSKRKNTSATSTNSTKSIHVDEEEKRPDYESTSFIQQQMELGVNGLMEQLSKQLPNTVRLMVHDELQKIQQSSPMYMLHGEFKGNNMNYNVGEQLSNQPWHLQPQPWDLQGQPWDLQPQPWHLQPQPWDLQGQPWSLQSQPWSLESQPWHLQTQPWNLHSQPWSLQPQLWDVPRANISCTADLKGNAPQLIDPNAFVDVMRRNFGIQLKPLERPVYHKPYPNWVDIVPFPHGFKIPNFSTFSGEDEKSTIEHISHFIAQCAEARQNEFLRMQLFPLSLTGLAFTWYSNLPPNSVHNWIDMERVFHDRFYQPQQKVTIADLMNIKQQIGEPVANFVERFSKMTSNCNVKLPEMEFAAMAIGNMLPRLKKRLISLEFTGFTQLTIKASRMEQFVNEKEPRIAEEIKDVRPELVSIEDYDSAE